MELANPDMLACASSARGQCMCRDTTSTAHLSSYIKSSVSVVEIIQSASKASCFLLKIASSLRLILGLASDAAGHDIADSEDSREEHADNGPLEWLSHVVLLLASDKTTEKDGESSSEDSKNENVSSIA